LDRTRARIAAIVLVSALVGFYLAYRAGLGWLADQPTYQVEFRAIELDPPPPTWYRGGKARFLEEVRRVSGMPERIALLKLAEDELKHAFEHDPWTEKVTRVSNRPLGVTVHLVYHQPVALVEISPHEKYLIDESAIILPSEDLDRDLDEFARQECLITIKGAGLAAPRNPKPGLRWKSPAGSSEVAPGNGQIRGAAKLARFLADKRRTVDRISNPSLGFLYINPMDDAKDYRGLFLFNAESTYILWGEAPGEESPGNLMADEKWEKLLEWSRSQTPRVVPPCDFWQITAAGVIHKIGRPSPPESARLVPGTRDRSAMRAKGSGHRAESVSH
jgi:hypothetical protein